MSQMRYAIVVNTPVPESGGEDVPRKDYMLVAQSLNAQVIGPRPGNQRGGRFIALLAQAWHAFRRRHEYDVVVTMSEQVGLLLALLFKVARCDKTHVMVSHYLTPFRKSGFLRLLNVDSHITMFICYGSAQASFLTEDLGIPADKVETVLHPADSLFWRPMAIPTERVIVSAGMLARDYGTLLKAVEGLDVDVVIAADSPWVNGGRRQSNGRVPNKVRFVRCTPSELRDLYSHSLFVVVPLTTANVQAGSLVIYESMAMGKAVVTTANGGNVDIVTDGETGYYAPPGDHRALRQAIERLLNEPAQARRMGARARQMVERGLNLDSYVRSVTQLVRQSHRQRATTTKGGRLPRRPTAVGHHHLAANKNASDTLETDE